MNPPTYDDLDYLHFWVAAQPVFSTTAAVRCHQGATAGGPAHDVSTA